MNAIAAMNPHSAHFISKIRVCTYIYIHSQGQCSDLFECPTPPYPAVVLWPFEVGWSWGTRGPIGVYVDQSKTFNCHFKLRISGSHHTGACLHIIPQSSSGILEGYAARIPVYAKKTRRFIDYIKNNIFISNTGLQSTSPHYM